MGLKEIGRRGVGAIEERQPLEAFPWKAIQSMKEARRVLGRGSACVLHYGAAVLPLLPSEAEFLKGKKCFCVHLIVSTAWQRTGREADA